MSQTKKGMKQHPLLNLNSSTHYYTNTKASIWEYEQNATVSEMIAVCNFEIFKHTSRASKKTSIKGLIKDVLDLYYANRLDTYASFKQSHLQEIEESDKLKIKTWKNYKALLESIPTELHNMSVANALKSINITLDYKI